MSSNRQRLLPTIAAITASAALCSASPAAAQSYGRLIVRDSATPSTSFATAFSHVRPPRSFLLVVTEPNREPLDFKWSVHCVGSKSKESGGAFGRARVTSGHWVKQVQLRWIKHPVSCSGTIEGSAAASPVLVRVFAD